MQRLIADLAEAGSQAALERGANLDTLAEPVGPSIAQQRARRRSEDWAQVRPEWGLSKNSLIIIGRRALTQTVNLQGRAFLHSYDHWQDASGKLLETIMTAPLVVAQWINMEHYFSTVDNEVYGSGSKVYHNVAGRIGVMTGVWSDLRIGLPAQTVWNGREPYHEPMRLLAVIKAPRERIRAIINRQPLLEQLFDRGWMTLMALEPQDGVFYQCDGLNGWTWIQGGSHDQLNTASHERKHPEIHGRGVRSVQVRVHLQSGDQSLACFVSPDLLMVNWYRCRFMATRNITDEVNAFRPSRAEQKRLVVVRRAEAVELRRRGRLQQSVLTPQSHVVFKGDLMRHLAVEYERAGMMRAPVVAGHASTPA